MKKSISRRAIFLAGLLSLASSYSAVAAVVYETDFESPVFVPGPIVEQDGWTGGAEIVSTEGGQVGYIDASGGFNSGEKPTSTAFDSDFIVTVDFLVTGPGVPQSGPQIIGDTGFISQLVAIDSTSYYLGNLNSNTPPQSFAAGEWHELEIRLDFDAFTMSGWVDGVFLGTLPINNEIAPTTITEIGIYAFDSGPEAPGIFFDNLSIVGTVAIPVGDPNLNGGDLSAVIADPELTGNVEVAGGGPWRVRDDRPHCQPGATAADATTPLVFDGTTVFNVNDADALLPLVVSDNGADPVQYFTIQATSCGIPRASYNGDPVLRTASDSVGDWTPYLDIVELESDIVPIASVLGFESNGLDGTAYACKPPATASLATQPLMEINVREFEAKILKGVPGTIDEVTRDITVDCGSKRSKFKGYSFVAWNLVHAVQVDIRAEIEAEIDVLVESTTRYSACVDPSFYYGQLTSWPFYIKMYYDYGVYFATTGGNQAFAEFYFDAAVTMIELFKSNLEVPGASDNFLRCYATSVDPALSPRLDLIKNTTTPLPTDVPLNAWGDIVSQLEHLSYAIRTYRDELAAP